MLTRSQCLQWIDALRSGKYTQGQGVLKRTYREDFIKGTQTLVPLLSPEYCCLGVLGEVCNLPNSGEDDGEGPVFLDYSVLPKPVQHALSSRNDGSEDRASDFDGLESWDFLQIADYIETHILPSLED